MNADQSTVYLSLGSNLGHRKSNLDRALAGLSNTGVQVTCTSSCYRTDPVEYLPQPEFLNLVCRASCRETPIGLLRLCLDLETQMGRIRRYDKGPRLIDIDILYYDDRIVRRPDLMIPHPARLRRRFVLLPLAEIAPDFLDPIKHKSILQLLGECPDQSRVELLSAPADGSSAHAGPGHGAIRTRSAKLL